MDNLRQKIKTELENEISFQEKMLIFHLDRVANKAALASELISKVKYDQKKLVELQEHIKSRYEFELNFDIVEYCLNTYKKECLEKGIAPYLKDLQTWTPNK